MTTSTLNELNEAANFIKKRLKLDDAHKIKVAVVLGSGLSAFADSLKEKPRAFSVSFQEIPHFAASTVDGHKGEMIFGLLDNQYPIIAMNGRLHFYEGYEAQDVILPIRVLGLLGISTVILTNASGAIADGFEPGHLMVIQDHINLTGHSPLVGPNLAELGPRFVDMTESYDKELIKIAKVAAMAADIKMHEGVYGSMLGPCYETPAEIRMLKRLGVDAVGMSTVFETIAARHMGLRVLAISCLTNKAAGLSSKKISHEEVMENNAKVANKLGLTIRTIISQLHDSEM